MKNLMRTFIAGMLWLPLIQVSASDYAKEKRWADQITGDLMDGEAVWLEADGHRFLGLYTEAGDKPKGAVIILHGIGVHPDWPQVISPLRTRLPALGWTTLSLQMPVLLNEATVSDYATELDSVAPRIEAGVQFLQDKGYRGKIAMVAHSLGAAMATDYLARNPGTAIQTLVAIGMTSNANERLDNARNVSKTKRSILDIYGENDLPEVTSSAPARKAAKRYEGTFYLQMEIPGADHFFEGYEDVLVDETDNWLSYMLTGESTKKPDLH